MIRRVFQSIIVVAVVALTAGLARAQPILWENYRDPEFGYSIDLPLGLLEPTGGTEGRLTFVEPDGQAQLVLYAEANPDRRSLEEIKSSVRQSAGIEEVTYETGGDSWFVLSGYFRLDDDDANDVIFYLKLMQSPDRRRHAVFALHYPRRDKERFDPIVERLESSFRRPR